MRRVSVVLTGRADASPLAPLMSEMRALGMAVSELRLDVHTIGHAASYADYQMLSYRPDIVVVLGDRWESLGAAYAATYNRIPIAHIHGGEVTRGSFDNQIRDAITKLSHMHFVATLAAYDRLVFDLDEWHERVHWVGAPGMDRFVDMPGRDPEKKFVVTWHPVTLCPEESAEHLVDALLEFPEFTVTWTSPNNDPGPGLPAGVFDKKITPDEYIAHCRTAAAIIGNSSSGIIEAPYMEVPSVNVGSRQEGREMGPSVICCACDKGAIVNAINAALAYDGPYHAPYGGPGASSKIARILKDAPLDGILVK